MTMQTGQQIQLRNGHTLGYLEVGDPQGEPVFHFHGWPGSRLEVRLFGDMPARLGIRLIGVDRPGVGCSGFYPGRAILDWPEDVAELAGVLGIERFAVQGWSGGGPYVAACAYKIPERLTAGAFLAGMGPQSVPEMMGFMRLIYFSAPRFPTLIPILLWLVWGRSARDQVSMEASLRQFKARISGRDQAAYDRPEFLSSLAASMVESLRQGSRALAYDAVLVGRPWGFCLEEINHPRLFLFHGKKDTNVPVSIGRFVASKVPNIQARFYPDDGHASLIADHGEEILALVAGRQPSRLETDKAMEGLLPGHSSGRQPD